ncbi:von Willebrand factor A domain-containing protein 1-like [Salmo salar]|uniref:von Willebrand factor A domain-containing protein 1 n=1 Tax=Salmo salar TaxID=8030 RepID=A0A1S3P3Z3_SALSA|nr:von Willebrand factor A domain-containing protein 1-like [Salmo salar]|eukprot:XP_014022319.1 PREDICTED: von Willebrand factor A domain-containing protein 1-like [Salmo salar]
MMEWLGFSCLLLGVLLWPSSTQNVVPDTALNCCEGDILLLLDSSGSVSSYEFSRLLHFLSELLLPFSLGRGQVRAGLLQVGTEPHLEFGLDAHSTQPGLQGALQRTRQLQGDTNTEAALRLAQGLLARAGAGDELELPKVLVWLTDGVQPGMVDGPMAELRRAGVSLLAVSTGHGNYQVLQRVVTPPIESHLYFVDIDDISIITEDLREAIIELIRVDRLRVVQVSSHSAVLQWRPVLGSNTDFYSFFRYSSVLPGGGEGQPNGGASSGGQYHRRTLPRDASWVELRGLQPDTIYTASLTPNSQSNHDYLNTLSVTFTTLPEVLSPAVVTVADSGPDRVRVSWGPLQTEHVQRYQIEYGALPSGQVHTVRLHGDQNSTLLTGLEPDTQYLVTVSALYSTGKEKAMSVKACTQEVLPALADLQLTPVGCDAVQVRWWGHDEGLRAYWLNWERGETQSPSRPAFSSLYLPPGSLSTLLTHLAPSSRVCVSPVYRMARGEGLCCTARTQTGLILRAHIPGLGSIQNFGIDFHSTHELHLN